MHKKIFSITLILMLTIGFLKLSQIDVIANQNESTENTGEKIELINQEDRIDKEESINKEDNVDKEESTGKEEPTDKDESVDKEESTDKEEPTDKDQSVGKEENTVKDSMKIEIGDIKNGYITANAKIQVQKDLDATLVVAIYGKGNSFIKLASTTSNIIAGEKKSINTKLKLPKGVKNYTVKAFLWDDLDNIRPLASSVKE